ncbi:DNA-directed RNA polymerase I subunit RPA12 isoform X1 [Pteropus medius]|uniref:DNA-directed RNA polymerase I subunit RPA12 isoform X1 n=1 Tax=Pteropus vampyrus TaxID=132908 RepID=A0A6P6C1G9_PTEVA|nr:DNA-directed RNA polymerase I subunit RPA12 isoform X1 [Pteropus vampyrus]XP_023381165.1 DNA-directed RNA polymerase I subunit RPA12 isoform X1 [Pteropus vampyrus]XP_023381166.1 DNA-directed RNA polymerase I subunit RPA12 isoform X1 [Pteropus vampyrus]XP_023381167.1 DNA-directed RNA polymerase I subunit RPA12 isoform X1 [Pteropus vampyrus]XP_039707064.1 DNA-directed RNA polymerase I subunit RPA12 isoform X1 [Pteropus giganteus]XP_039707065.1 DNA-directed RNA polymerase I subunit RPA12 isofo
MDLAGTGSSFQSDLDFCPDCGSVLPLPGTQDTVTCTRCGFSINVRVLTACADFEGKVVKTSFVFHKLGTAMPMSMEGGPEFQGPVLLPRLTGAALDVVMREWHTTPDRCARRMKGRLSSTPVPTASSRRRKTLNFFFWMTQQSFPLLFL